MYSPEIRLHLEVGDRRFPLAKLGPDYIVFREPVEFEPGLAEVVMELDDHTKRWKVQIERAPLPFDLQVPTIDVK